MLSTAKVAVLLTFLPYCLANVCSAANGKTWQGVYSSSCSFTDSGPNGGWGSTYDGPFCTLTAQITSDERNVFVKIDKVMPSTCSLVRGTSETPPEPGVPPGPVKPFTVPPNFFCANYGQDCDASSGQNQISASLGTTNGTIPFGESDCSTGLLQFNVSSYKGMCAESDSNYSATLQSGVLKINRTLHVGAWCRRLRASAGIRTASTETTCHDTWTFYAPSPVATIKGAVSIQSRESGMCLDLPGGDTANGKQLMTWPCLGSENQQWQFQEFPVPRLVYAPSLKSGSPKCVDVMAGNFTNGQPLQIWDCAGTPQQMWAFDKMAGLVYLLNANAEWSTSHAKCFDLRNGGMKNATAVQIWDCSTAIQGGLATGWNQQWSLSSSASSESMNAVMVV